MSTGTQWYACCLALSLTAFAGCRDRSVEPSQGAAKPVASSPTGRLPVGTEGRAVEGSPGTSQAADPAAPDLTRQADSAMQAGKSKEALDLYERALLQNPEDEEAHFSAGFISAQMGRTNEAMAHYRECIRILPEYAEAHNNLGNLLRKGGRPDEAILHFETSLRHSPTNSSAHNNLGTTLALQGRVPESIPHFVRAVELNPAYAEAWLNLGTAYLQSGRTEESVRPLQNALTLNPGLDAARRALSRAGERLSKSARPLPTPANPQP